MGAAADVESVFGRYGGGGYGGGGVKRMIKNRYEKMYRMVPYIISFLLIVLIDTKRMINKLKLGYISTKPDIAE